MEVCDIRKFDCCDDVDDDSLDNYDKFYLSDGVCKCLPACNSIEYKVEVFTSKFTEKYIKSEILHTSEFNIKYKESEVYPLIRYQQFKSKDFLSCVGGLLGLFAGISVLSIIELFYFFSLRPLMDIYRFCRS